MFNFYGQSPLMAGQTINVDKKSFCQTLTAEDIESLKQTTEEFTLGITNREKLVAICMHRDINGNSTLVPDSVTGEVKCLICGEQFQIVDRCSEKDIENAVKNLLDVLQTTKALYIDMPSDAARNFYTIIALIKKIPGLYKVATDNFSKHENAMNGAWSFNSGNGVLNEYAALTGSFNPYMMGFGMQQPMMQPQMGGAVYGQPMQGPVGQQNPFGFNGAPQAAPVYNPQMNGFAYTPGVAAPQAAPVAPAAPAIAEAPKAEEVTVASNFQA